MLDPTMSKEIDAAVTFWTEQLGNRYRRSESNLDQAENPAAKAAISVAYKTGGGAVSGDVVQKFSDILRGKLQAIVAARPPRRIPDPYYYFDARMDVDYNAYGILVDAFEEAGGNPDDTIMYFPHKTSVEMNPGHVRVRTHRGIVMLYEAAPTE